MLDKLSYLNSIGAPEGHGEVTITPDTYVHKEEEEDEDDEPMGDPSNSEYIRRIKQIPTITKAAIIIIIVQNSNIIVQKINTIQE